jgi:hypothetical protein
LATAADEIEAEVAAAAVAAEAASDAEITRQSHELASRVRRMSGEIEQGKPVEREGKVLDTSLERLASRIRRRVNAR